MDKHEMMANAVQELRRQIRESEIADDIAQNFDSLEILKLAKELSGQDIHGYSYQNEENPDDVAIFEKENGLWYYRGNMKDYDLFCDLVMGMARMALPILDAERISVPELARIYL